MRVRRRAQLFSLVSACTVLAATGCAAGGPSASGAALDQASCDKITSGAAAGAGASPKRPGGDGRSLHVQQASLRTGLPKTAASGKTINFVGGAYTGTTEAYWKDLAGKFEAANPGYKVNIRIIDWNNIDQQVSTMIQTKQYPDVLNQNKFSGWAANGLLQPIDSLVSPEVGNDFIPSFKENSFYKGSQYGLPLIASTRALFYNKDIFAKAGIDKPPATWAELVVAAQKIKAAGYTGYGLPLGGEENQGEWSLWMWSNGGDWKSNDQWSVSSDRNVESLNFLSCLANVYQVTQPNPGQTNRTDGVFRPFANGQTGMIMGASFAPSLFKQWNSTVDYGIAPIPVNKGTKPFTLGVQDYLVSFKNPGNTEAVSKFLNFFYQTDNYVRFLTSQGFLPTTKTASAALKDEPDFAPYLDLLPIAKFYPSTDPGFPKAQGTLEAQLGTALTPGADTKSVLDQVQTAATQGNGG
ncbi:extracellular solute-binding protein [Streptosporangium sp. NPDC020072]|uniref:extracellular solute-binding protein n=1 Tax=Streptosporangium sp. NPDC020072 TaxID=3154788 RepID=UPI003430761F